MNLREIPALVRRHLIAVLIVLAIAAGVAYGFKSTPPVYQESAIAVFVAPPSTAHPNPYASFNSALLATADIVTRFLDGPQGQRQVRAAGGSAGFGVSMVNLYNEEYPNYSQPYVQVSVSSPNPAVVHSTFLAVTQVLVQDLATRQTQQNVAANNRIRANFAGDAGPIAQYGSSKRTMAGLLLLTIIAILFVAIFLDKHPVRLSRFNLLLRSKPRDLSSGGRSASASA